MYLALNFHNQCKELPLLSTGLPSSDDVWTLMWFALVNDGVEAIGTSL
jgi:hypothetical protein